MSRCSARRLPSRQRSAFTLIELMVVIGIMTILMVLLVPALTSMKSAGDVTAAANSVAALIEQARAYAMANNTFVWMGFKEVDASRDSSASPQNVGVGRVAVAIVASKDGTRGYDVTNPSPLPNPAWTNYNNGSNLLAITKLQRFENVHLATTLNGYGNPPPTSGNMARPYVQSNNYDIGNAPAAGSILVTPFDWPLGSAINAGQYSFKKVINFDPQGVLRIQYAGNGDFIGEYVEVGLQQTHGTTVSPSANVAAVQINCVSGTVRKYRP